MGHWGYGPFDSDNAHDFLEDLACMDDVVGHLREILSQVADAPGRVESQAGDDAVVAAALTRLLNPQDNDWYSLWAKSNATEEVTAELQPFRQALTEP